MGRVLLYLNAFCLWNNWWNTWLPTKDANLLSFKNNVKYFCSLLSSNSIFSLAFVWRDIKRGLVTTKDASTYSTRINWAKISLSPSIICFKCFPNCYTTFGREFSTSISRWGSIERKVICASFECWCCVCSASDSLVHGSSNLIARCEEESLGKQKCLCWNYRRE